MPITPKTGSLFHADSQKGDPKPDEERTNQSSGWHQTCPERIDVIGTSDFYVQFTIERPADYATSRLT
jgi:hypothetical protein